MIQQEKNKSPKIQVNVRLRNRIFILIVLLIITAAITTMRSVISATRGYELVQTKQKAAQLENENRQLELQIAQLRSPSRIRDYATEHLDMVVPKDAYFSLEQQK